jgi:hypothetical protein
MHVPESTAKTWKLQIIVGRAVAIYGLLVFVHTFTITRGELLESVIAAIPYYMSGMIMGWLGKIGAYWFHG